MTMGPDEYRAWSLFHYYDGLRRLSNNYVQTVSKLRFINFPTILCIVKFHKLIYTILCNIHCTTEISVVKLLFRPICWNEFSYAIINPDL